MKDYSCIAFRLGSGVSRWEFDKGRRALTVYPQGRVSFDDPELVIEAALQGLGLGMAVEAQGSELIRKGRLVQVLADWCPSFPGYFLYYLSRRNQSAALTALVHTLRMHL